MGDLRTKFINHFAEVTIPFIVAFIMPLPLYIVCIGFIVMADYFTGIQAAKKRKERISSDKRFRSVPKFIIYGMLVIIARFMETIFLEGFPATQLTAAFVCYVELTSIDENIKDITGKHFLKGIIDKLNPKGKR